MLRLKSENLRSKLRRMPLLRALPPLAAGILLADHYVLPLWLLVGGFLVCGILALLADDRGANLAILGAILLFGMTVTELTAKQIVPFQEKMTPVWDMFADKIGKDLIQKIKDTK